MPDRANVSSLEAMETFRARLIVYREKAGRVLDEIHDEVIRTRVWLEKDCPARWNAELKRLNRELEQRQQELFSAQISNLQDASAVQHMAVQKARRAIREVEAKLLTVRNWNRQYDHRVEPPARQAETIRPLTPWCGSHSDHSRRLSANRPLTRAGRRSPALSAPRRRR